MTIENVEDGMIPTMLITSAPNMETLQFGGNIKLFGSSTATDPVIEAAPNLKNIIFENVEEIGRMAFDEFEPLEQITLSGTTKIDEKAFRNCVNLSKVVMTDINIIGLSAFEGCTALTDVQLSENMSLIDYGAFNKCTSLTNLNINSVDTLGYNFIGNTAIEEIHIGHVGTANESAFNAQNNLKKIVIDDVDVLSNGMFIKGHTDLGTIHIKNVGTIERGAFKEITARTIIIDSIEDGLVPAAMILNSPNVETLKISGHIKLFGNTTGTDAVVQFNIGDLEHNIKNVILEQVDEIGRYAFKNHDKMEQIKLNGTTKINYGAFSGCSSLSDVVMEDIKEIGEYAFSNCTALAEIDLHNVESIGDYAFTTCYNMETITIPASVKEIDLGNLPHQRSTNDESKQHYYTAIIEGTDTEISFAGALSNRYYLLNKIVVPYESVAATTIINNKGGFTKISGTEEYVVYNEDHWAPNVGFAQSDIQELSYIGEQESEDGEWIYVDTGKGGVAVKPSDNNISGSVTIPEEIDGQSVIELYPGAFANSDVSEVTVPGSVTNIGNGAFANTGNLDHIYFPGGGPIIWGDGVFNGAGGGNASGAGGNLTIHAPSGSGAADYASSNKINSSTDMSGAGDTSGVGGGSGSGGTEGGGSEGGNTGSGDTTGGNKIDNSKEDVEYYPELETEEVYNGANKECKVYVSQQQELAVRLPFKMVANGQRGVENSVEYEVEVRGNLSGADIVKVEHEKEIEMITVGKRPIKATITQDQTEFSVKKDGQEALELGKITNGKVVVHNLSAGKWVGYNEFTIKVEGIKIDDSEENTGNVEVETKP